MANTKSAIKMIRVATKRRLRNRSTKSSVKTYVGKAEHALTASTPEAEEAVRQAASMLDKAATKGVIHKNTAARRKARLMKKLNQAAS